jgi:hypothetical protein
MINQDDEPLRFPLLEALSKLRGLPLLSAYRTRDVAALFGVSPRAISDRVADGRLQARDLPGRFRHLPQDIEQLLATSVKRHQPLGSEPLPPDLTTRRRRRNVQSAGASMSVKALDISRGAEISPVSSDRTPLSTASADYICRLVSV